MVPGMRKSFINKQVCLPRGANEQYTHVSERNLILTACKCILKSVFDTNETFGDIGCLRYDEGEDQSSQIGIDILETCTLQAERLR